MHLLDIISNKLINILKISGYFKKNFSVLILRAATIDWHDLYFKKLIKGSLYQKCLKTADFEDLLIKNHFE